MAPTGEVLAGVRHWPALFIGRGLWDFSESLEGTFDCLRRCAGPRMITPLRGPHGEGEWGAENTAYLQGRMTEFATAVLQGRAVEDYVEPKTLREVVALAPRTWPETARPAALGRSHRADPPSNQCEGIAAGLPAPPLAFREALPHC